MYKLKQYFQRGHVSKETESRVTTILLFSTVLFSSLAILGSIEAGKESHQEDVPETKKVYLSVSGVEKAVEQEIDNYIHDVLGFKDAKWAYRKSRAHNKPIIYSDESKRHFFTSVTSKKYGSFGFKCLVTGDYRVTVNVMAVCYEHVDTLVNY